MFGKRNSITQLLGFDVEEETQIIGKEIGHPTKSQPVRAWAEETKTNDSSNAELKHSQMQLLAERDRVQQLEKTLKNLMDQKYSNQSSIINQLQQSQNVLREQLTLVISSKMNLCETTSLEIERLRLIISELTVHINKDDPTFSIKSIIAKHKLPSQQQPLYNLDASLSLPLEQQLNESQNLSYNASMPHAMQPFPHRDASRIDIRTVQAGDGVTYPDPFAAVDLKYTGYKYLIDTNEWTKFTSTNISLTVFETRLGNHENIIGLEQAVLSMTKGEVARVWVPSRLGYGVHGAEPLIPPNTDLVFELTLVEIRNDFQQQQGQQNDEQQQQMQQQQQDEYEEEDVDELTTNNLQALNNINHSQYDDEDDDYNTNPQSSFQVL